MIRHWGRTKEWVPAAPFAEWLNQRVEHWTRYHDAFHKWMLTPPPENGALRSVCREVGWLPNPEARTSRAAWEAPIRRLYRARRMLTDAKTRGRGFPKPTDVFLREVVEEALFHADVSLRDLYEDYSDRMVGSRGSARDVLRHIEIWEPLAESLAWEDAPLERDVWCSRCKEHVTPISGRCPWHAKPSRLERVAV